MRLLWETIYCGERIDNSAIRQEFVQGKQTYSQLAAKYKCSLKTIQRRLDSIKSTSIPKTPRAVVVLMDTTYWSRNFGLMLFKDSITKDNLLKYYVRSETNALYKQGIEELKSKGYCSSYCLRWP